MSCPAGDPMLLDVTDPEKYVAIYLVFLMLTLVWKRIVNYCVELIK